jgi:hypothetical protein
MLTVDGFCLFVEGGSKEGELRGARSFKGCGDGGLHDSGEAEFSIGLLKELRNDFPSCSLAVMTFEKCMFSYRSLSDFFEAGHNFLNTIRKMVRQAFHEHLFHVIVEAEENERGLLCPGVPGP